MSKNDQKREKGDQMKVVKNFKKKYNKESVMILKYKSFLIAYWESFKTGSKGEGEY